MQNFHNQLQHAFILVSKPDNKSIKQGQSLLARLKTSIEYPKMLLSYMANQNTYEGKLRSAIQLRIWCEYYKNLEEFERKGYAGIIDDIKTNILYAFISFKDKIEQTLLPGIVALTVVEFPDNWPNLVKDLIGFSQNNQQNILKILQLLAQITHKYSYLSRSDTLYSQIIIVCNEFHDYFLTLTKLSVQNILKNQQRPQCLKILQKLMNLFYNLNYQDLHPHFQDHLSEWMQILNKVMQLPNNNQKFFKCKGAALQSILLYANKYKDDVEDSIKGFMQQIWNLCSKASEDPQYDDVVTNALKYFKSLIGWQDMRQNFANNIDNIISNLILPNLNLTQQYKDMFNEDIQSFISFFFKNAQTLSRRSNAIELLQSIVRLFKQNYQNFLGNQIHGFQPSPQKINMQCLLLTLVIQSAPKGFRQVDGVVSLHYNQSIITYCYQTFIKQTLNKIFTKSSNSTSPIQSQIQIMQLLTTLRYIFYFRIYIPHEDLNLILKLCCNMKVQNQSVKQIVILIVYAIVTIKHGDFTRFQNIVYYYQPDKMDQVAECVLGMIGRYEKESQQLNAGLNRLFWAVVKQLKLHNEKYYQNYTNDIVKSMLCRTQPFIFSSVLPLFQAIGYLTYYLCLKTNENKLSYQLEQVIQKYFKQMIKIQSDILNFCFQILSIFLRYSTTSSSNALYTSIYQSILYTQNWTFQNQSLISSYIQYIISYITIHQQKIIDNKSNFQLILTKLIDLQNYELFYRLLKGILKCTKIQGFYKYGYMNILIKGTTFVANKGIQGKKMGMIFLFEIMYDYDVSLVIKSINQIQNNFIQNYLLASQDIIRSIQAFRSRKLMFSAICNAIATKSFSSLQNESIMLNLLIQNTSYRFRRDAFTPTLPSSQNTIKKQSTYQKLQVFKQIQNEETSNMTNSQQKINIDEQMVLLQTFNMCVNNDGNVKNFIQAKNMEKIQKIFEKNQNNVNRNVL